jgi:iron-sulfur cluster assembly protein
VRAAKGLVSGDLLADEKRKVTHMLVLTEAAAEVVKAVTSTPQAPEGSGLRITSAATESGDPGALQVAAATGPGENDQVIDAAGAHVFLEPQAAAYLEDKVLDAQLDTEGKAHFSLGVQRPGQA